jgi:hypothetical protein
MVQIICESNTSTKILMEIPTKNVWTLYSHFISTPENYNVSFTELCSVRSFSDFGRMWNHTHPKLVGDATRIIQVKGRRVTSWSLFKDHIKPAWEDEQNKNCITFTLKQAMNVTDAYKLWETMVSQCVLSSHPPTLNGVQVSRKSGYIKNNDPGLLMKFDVWFHNSTQTSDAKEWMQETFPLHSFEMR